MTIRPIHHRGHGQAWIRTGVWGNGFNTHDIYFVRRLQGFGCGALAGSGGSAVYFAQNRLKWKGHWRKGACGASAWLVQVLISGAINASPPLAKFSGFTGPYN
ncbi:hypothetical protein GCM10011498_05180 [Amylibacter cionae]|uniref:Uncharacterized protein n=1 Tax=Neptunicoccus cionae TaxID=2035344 RepID=A0A916VMA6_9RHOB|nr:hypothetical protein GCM10011498_05180 [Amylibacter cionae]